MTALPLSMKLLVPGYRGRWLARYAGMIAEFERVVPELAFGTSDDGVPWIERREDGLRFHGFWTEPANLEVWRILRPAMPAALDPRWFRLVKDYINRFLYPHMRPDLRPHGFAPGALFGFHGQHKDAIADYPDEVARAHLAAAFLPKPADIVLDCGAFLGFGDLHMSRAAPRGRIIAVEPDVDCYALLQRNLEHNRISNVETVQAAIWESEGELTLERSFAQANTLVAEVSRGEETSTVETVSVDALLKRLKVRGLDMLSLTLNGAEVEALKGATRTLERDRPRIRLAGWYHRGGKPIHELVTPILEAAGYWVFVGRRGNVMALPEEKAGPAK
ncbi:MAG TPA: FkbM family methyltransferase [Devosiaceae bacterium]|nr:FkbM family methyltransferase [Devosiaceae bacterium]